jgi:hypothetical protein
MGTRGSFPGGKAAGREADHSPPFNAEVKNEWNYTSISQYAFMAWCLVKHRDNFTFTFTSCTRNEKLSTSALLITYEYRRGQD